MIPETESVSHEPLAYLLHGLQGTVQGADPCWSPERLKELDFAGPGGKREEL